MQRQRYTQLEINTILQLRSKGYSVNKISELINNQFNTNRTPSNIHKKLLLITKDKKENKKLLKEDNILISYIRKYPTNIRYAITLASEELNLSITALSHRYYTRIKHSIAVLTVGSEIGFSNNVKNTLRDINGNLPTPDMNDVQWLMKQILNLSEKDRNTIKLLLQ